MNRRLISGIGVVCLSGLIILSGLSGFAQKNTTPPLIGSPLFNNGWYDSALANGYLQKRDFDNAAGAAQFALSRDVTDSRAVRVMALAAEGQGDTETAQKWLAAGAALGWRDSAIQIKLFEYAIKNQNYAASLDHADSLLRRRVASDQMTGIFLIAARDEQLSGDIAAKLATEPSWRPVFFANKQASDPENRAGFERVAMLLRKTVRPATRYELTPYTAALVSKKNGAAAMQLWNQLFPGDGALLASGKSAALRWPNGDSHKGQRPTNWTLIDNAKAFPSVDARNDGTDAALEIDMQDDAVGRLATRIILLPAGRVMLNLTPGSSDQGLDALGWTLSCDDGSQLQRFDRTPGKSQWTANVPAGCSAHRINLELENIRGGNVVVTLGKVQIASLR